MDGTTSILSAESFFSSFSRSDFFFFSDFSFFSFFSFLELLSFLSLRALDADHLGEFLLLIRELVLELYSPSAPEPGPPPHTMSRSPHKLTGSSCFFRRSEVLSVKSTLRQIECSPPQHCGPYHAVPQLRVQRDDSLLHRHQLPNDRRLRAALRRLRADTPASAPRPRQTAIWLTSPPHSMNLSPLWILF